MLNLRLKELREEKGLQQKDVAEDLKISRQVYNNYELGKREPDYLMLVRLSEYFGKTTDYLLGATEISPQTKKEPTPHEELVQEFSDLIKLVPVEKLPKVKNLLFPTVDAIS